LVTNGSGVLSFAAVGASAGQVIQVLSATDSTQRSTTSTSYVTASNTLSVTITPSSASNKILILVSSAVTADSNDIGSYTIFRGATNITGANGFGVTRDAGGGAQCNIGINFLDSPNTTSATTYQVYMKVTGNAAYLNAGSRTGTITVLEIKG
jgi:hypothetical protein